MNSLASAHNLTSVIYRPFCHGWWDNWLLTVCGDCGRVMTSSLILSMNRLWLLVEFSWALCLPLWRVKEFWLSTIYHIFELLFSQMFSILVVRWIISRWSEVAQQYRSRALYCLQNVQAIKSLFVLPHVKLGECSYTLASEWLSGILRVYIVAWAYKIQQ